MPIGPTSVELLIVSVYDRVGEPNVKLVPVEVSVIVTNVTEFVSVGPVSMAVPVEVSVIVTIVAVSVSVGAISVAVPVKVFVIVTIVSVSVPVGIIPVDSLEIGPMTDEELS